MGRGVTRSWPPVGVKASHITEVRSSRAWRPSWESLSDQNVLKLPVLIPAEIMTCKEGTAEAGTAEAGTANRAGRAKIDASLAALRSLDGSVGEVNGMWKKQDVA